MSGVVAQGHEAGGEQQQRAAAVVVDQQAAGRRASQPDLRDRKPKAVS